MKSIIFGGCSFTWGEGLYYYSDFNNLIVQNEGQFDHQFLTDAHLRYKDTLRFPRLVANHFNTIEIVKSTNGGSDLSTIEFVNQVLGEGENNVKYTINEIDYIIFQTSQIVRNGFEFSYGGEIHDTSKMTSDKPFVNWLIENNLTYDEWFETYKQNVFNTIKNFLTLYENRGIKTKILCWQNDLIELIKNDDFTNKRHIKLEYSYTTYNSISDLIDHNKNMTISSDYMNFKSPINNKHPSKLCHQIIANNIIENITKDL
jgi:hypothetical protein